MAFFYKAITSVGHPLTEFALTSVGHPPVDESYVNFYRLFLKLTKIIVADEKFSFVCSELRLVNCNLFV
jgi:hypothetical protein